MNIQQKTEQIVSKLRGTDDYNFISSKMGEVCISHLIESTLELLENEKQIHINKAGEACVVLAKILSQKQLTDITDDELSISKMYIENKRRQDESNYIRSLQIQIEELKHPCCFQCKTPFGSLCEKCANQD